MQVDTEVVCLFLGAVIAMQGWTLREVTRLKVRVAVLTALHNADRKNKKIMENEETN